MRCNRAAVNIIYTSNVTDQFRVLINIEESDKKTNATIKNYINNL